MFEKQFYHAKALSEVSSQLDADIPHYPPILRGQLSRQTIYRTIQRDGNGFIITNARI